MRYLWLGNLQNLFLQNNGNVKSNCMGMSKTIHRSFFLDKSDLVFSLNYFLSGKKWNMPYFKAGVFFFMGNSNPNRILSTSA
jgi:hypothetical protein